MSVTTFAVIGVHGFGVNHLRALAGEQYAETARVIAVADPRGPEGAICVPEDALFFADLDELLAEAVPDVVIIATPLHTHLPLAVKALRAGANVLLEKPTTTSLAEFHELVAVAQETGRAVQIGFQSFGSHVYAAVDEVVARGEIGEIVGVGGEGTWRRNLSYFARAPWAGRRQLDGRDVVDGVMTNAFAHAVATSLKLVHCTTAEDLTDVSVELFRANDIEADDTSSVRLTTSTGLPVVLGLTLCATDNRPPRLVIHGTDGTIEIAYTLDEMTVRTAAGERRETLGRTPLIANLIDHLTNGAPLVADARDTGAFMRFLEAVRTSPDPRPIAPELFDWEEDSEGRHPVVRDIHAWCARVADERATFTELGAPWTLERRS